MIPLGAATAQKKKEPLTLRQVGKNIGKESTRLYKNGEYGVRKGGENVSQTTNRAIGRDTKVRDRGAKKTEIVKPDGKRVPVNKNPAN